MPAELLVLSAVTLNEQADVEAACSGGGRDPLPPVVALVCREMLLYLQAVKDEDGKLAFQHYRGAYR